MPVIYDKEASNTIRKVELILTYPQIDDDCQDVTPESEGNNCHKLDIYAYNEEDEEARNTTETPLDGRDHMAIVMTTVTACNYYWFLHVYRD